MMVPRETLLMITQGNQVLMKDIPLVLLLNLMLLLLRNIIDVDMVNVETTDYTI